MPLVFQHFIRIDRTFQWNWGGGGGGGGGGGDHHIIKLNALNETQTHTNTVLILNIKS